MKQTWLIMGMPITVVIEDRAANAQVFQNIHDYFQSVDTKYSPFKSDSEVSRINDGLPEAEWPEEMKHILKLCEQTKQQTSGYFDGFRDGKLDPSGLVKGWAIQQAAELLHSMGFKQFYIDAGGDVQANGREWKVGIRNPFDSDEIIKVLSVKDLGVATSGTYIRGQHIYNPIDDKQINDIASLTVIGPKIYEADRFATAAFAMGRSGIEFMESLDGFEAYMIDLNQQATLTSGFNQYVEAA
ncbi:MAG: FAD:protein FMN transferase [Patescibacteria group bacterium]